MRGKKTSFFFLKYRKQFGRQNIDKTMVFINTKKKNTEYNRKDYRLKKAIFPLHFPFLKKKDFRRNSSSWRGR